MQARDIRQMSAMHHAISASLGPDAISVLTEWGLSTEVRDTEGRTPLHQLFRLDSYDVRGERFIALVTKGASVDARDSEGCTPLKYAIERGTGCESGYPGIRIQRLVQAGTDVNAAHDGGVSVLHVAARECPKWVLALLLDAGANIYACDYNQRTPLHYAMEATETANDIEKISFLVNRGADVNARDDGGNTPLQYLLNKDCESDSMSSMVEALVSDGADVNTVSDIDQKSPLHLAAKIGSKEILVLLLDAGANIYACDSKQVTPLDIATEQGWGADITGLLIEREGKSSRKRKAAGCTVRAVSKVKRLF